MRSLKFLKWEGYRLLQSMPWYAWGGGFSIATSAFVSFLLLLPMQESNEKVRIEIAHLRPKSASADAPALQHTQLSTFYAHFSAMSDLPKALNNILSLGAKANLNLDQGEYRLTSVPTLELVRYELNFPVKGSYAQVHQFVEEAMRAHPTLALQSITFSRDSIERSTLDAQLRFVLYGRKSTK